MDGPSFRRRTNDCKDLQKKLLTKDPEKRLSAKEALKHPWFKHMHTKDEFKVEEEGIALKNLSEFHSGKVLQTAALTYIVSQNASQKERDQMVTQFNALDLNQDGRLTADEL